MDQRPFRRGVWSRREFLERASLAASLAAYPWRLARAAAAPRWKIIAFSKPFTQLDFDATADLVADVGWDGIECPVRKTSTHIQPERAADDLPKMVEALKKRGRELTMITTDIVEANAETERLLRIAAKAGIKQYRLGPIHYVATRPIDVQLKDIGARLRDLAQLNKSIGILGGIENHSGADYFGAPIWDAYGAIKDLDPAAIGIAFDIGHATIEGGLSWPIEARLVEPRYTVVYIKDFRWEKTEKGWTPTWCPLGQGAVNKKFFATLAKSSYGGPIAQHHEYDLGKTPAENLAHYKSDFKILREWLNEAVAAG